MKWTSAIAIALTTALLTAVALFSLLPVGAQSSSVAAPAATVTPVDPVAANIQRTYQEREAVYQQQIDQLNQALAERQAVYPDQVAELNGRMAAATSTVEQLGAQEQALQAQLAELQAARGQRQALSAGQLQVAAQQYEERYSQMAAQLAEAQARLAEAKQLLVR